MIFSSLSVSNTFPSSLHVSVTEPNSAPENPTAVARTDVFIKYPNQPKSYFACELLYAFGKEVEGAQGILQGSGTKILALNIGNSLPPKGTLIIVSFIENRWIFSYS